MKTKTLLKLLSIFLLGLSTLYSQAIQEYAVNKINSQLTIDGHLNEDEWTSINPTNDFVILGNDQMAPKTATWAKLLWDEQFLYIGFFCEDLNIWSTYQNRDDQLWQEDAVEVYIDADGDGEKYIEFELNPINTIFDLWLTKPWSEGGWGHPELNFQEFSTATVVQGTVNDASDSDTAWTCEMALSFTEMQFAAISMNYPPLENEVWCFNMFRFDRNSTNDPNAEETGWNQTGGGQHVPDKFGKIIFSGEVPTDIATTHFNNFPDHFILYQNYPNPFNLYTTIEYSLLKSEHVTLTISDILGRTTAVLINEKQTIGSHKVKWSSDHQSTGIYFCQLKTGLSKKNIKLILVK